MSYTLDLRQLRRISIEERLDMIKQIWETILDEEDTGETPPEVLEELKRRLADFEANPDQGSPWEEVEAAPPPPPEDYEVALTPAAERDLQEASEWYEEQQEELGDDFLDEFKAAIERIRGTPLMHAAIVADLRRGRLSRYPFGIFYVVHENTIHVLAVLHDRRDPKMWQARLGRWRKEQS